MSSTISLNKVNFYTFNGETLPVCTNDCIGVYVHNTYDDSLWFGTSNGWKKLSNDDLTVEKNKSTDVSFSLNVSTASKWVTLTKSRESIVVGQEKTLTIPTGLSSSSVTINNVIQASDINDGFSAGTLPSFSVNSNYISGLEDNDNSELEDNILSIASVNDSILEFSNKKLSSTSFSTTFNQGSLPSLNVSTATGTVHGNLDSTAFTTTKETFIALNNESININEYILDIGDSEVADNESDDVQVISFGCVSNNNVSGNITIPENTFVTDIHVNVKKVNNFTIKVD